MYDLIARSLQGELTLLEQRNLNGWRRASPENERLYQELVWMWRQRPEVLPQGVPPSAPSAEDLLRGARGREPSDRLKRVLARGLPWVGLAAGVAALALGLPHGAPSQAQADCGFGVSHFNTNPTETLTVALNDGSFVRVAPGSRLEVGATQQCREVRLEGRAFFAIARDEGKPFLVRTRLGDAQVLGTRFEVRVEHSNLRLAVAEGTVALASPTGSVTLRQGDVSHLVEGQQPSVIHTDDIDGLLDWPGGTLLYQATPLSQVVRELERHFNVAVVMADSTLGARRVTGSFTNENLEDVLTAICRATGARCSIKQGQAILDL